MQVFNGSTSCVDKIKQSSWYINNSAVMFWRVTGERQLINIALKNGILESSPYIAEG